MVPLAVLLPCSKTNLHRSWFSRVGAPVLADDALLGWVVEDDSFPERSSDSCSPWKRAMTYSTDATTAHCCFCIPVPVGRSPNQDQNICFDEWFSGVCPQRQSRRRDHLFSMTWASLVRWCWHSPTCMASPEKLQPDARAPSFTDAENLYFTSVQRKTVDLD